MGRFALQNVNGYRTLTIRSGCEYLGLLGGNRCIALD